MGLLGHVRILAAAEAHRGDGAGAAEVFGFMLVEPPTDQRP